MKFTFTGEEFAGTKTTVEFHADSLDDVLNNFKQFLQGSGFVLGINEGVEVVDRSWEFGIGDNVHVPYPEDDGAFFNLSDYNYTQPDSDFDISAENISITIPEELKKKKGKK